ncbi:hypothetical protein BDK51DRAFT_26824 [Blyttiomyces helicus]|uniref:Uncharacterized protein n=1 Tax=Blyttiomyces helicus TaxID=388810 RepID=A0A4P9VZK0_9FUNG|nr:hypothetical protein BDK51DRAFT_26824 [Blyttiomyces helicus]|eukprot:RKO85251.1 hypothetical protein BDK51DRAFT_26824 [Blyttiomyces helicus]
MPIGVELQNLIVNFTRETNISLSLVPDLTVRLISLAISLYAADSSIYNDLAKAWLQARSPYIDIFSVDTIDPANYEENLVNFWDYDPQAGNDQDPKILSSYVVKGFNESGPETLKEIGEQAKVIVEGERSEGHYDLQGFTGQFLSYEDGGTLDHHLTILDDWMTLEGENGHPRFLLGQMTNGFDETSRLPKFQPYRPATHTNT